MGRDIQSEPFPSSAKYPTVAGEMSVPENALPVENLVVHTIGEIKVNYRLIFSTVNIFLNESRRRNAGIEVYNRPSNRLAL